MKLPSLMCWVALSLAWGCGSPASLPSQQQESVHQALVAQWSPDLLGPGGSMFGTANDFSAYVERASVIGSGILTQWNGREGTVRAERIFRGSVITKDLPVKATGGIVEPQIGDEVLFLLLERDGGLQLHSFCAASGLYPASQQLQSLVQSSLSAAE